MKRVFRVCVVALLATLSCYTANAEIIGLGISGGVNNANYSIKGYNGAISNDGGFQVGASATISIPIVSVTPEIWYTQNKFSITNSSILGTTCDVTSKSFDLPVVVGLNVGPLTLEAGPSFSLSSKAKAEFNGVDYDLGRINTTTGYVVGAKLTLFGIMVGARFNGQFGGYDTDFDLNKAVEYKVRKHSYSVSLGYKF